jgi:hypothetical protein
MPEFDERFFADLVDRHMRELSNLLANHAAFDAWCEIHNRKEPCPALTTPNCSSESSEPR